MPSLRFSLRLCFGHERIICVGTLQCKNKKSRTFIRDFSKSFGSKDYSRTIFWANFTLLPATRSM